jgi:hypothetical protein
MQPDPLAMLLHDYGWSAVLLWFAVREVWPWLRDRLLPQYISARKQKVEDDAIYRKRVETLESRQVAAFEKVAAAVEDLSKAMVLSNERMGNLVTNHGDHDMATRTGLTTLLARSDPNPTKPRRMQKL